MFFLYPPIGVVGWVLPFFTHHIDYHFQETGVHFEVLGVQTLGFSSDILLEVFSVFPMLNLVIMGFLD